MAKRPKNKKMANSQPPKKKGKKKSVKKKNGTTPPKTKLDEATGEYKPFWMFRAKHGRDKIIETPEILRQTFLEYIEHTESNPLIEEDFVGGGPMAGMKVHLKRKRPFTVMGFSIFCDASSSWWRNFKGNLKPKESKQDADFLTVINMIEEVCYSQKFEGAAAGFFNANIISRDLGLADKKILNAEKPIVIDWGEDKEEKDK